MADLPLRELAVKGAGHLFAIFLSGDGGFVALDRRVSAELNRRGIPVVGYSQLRYLWRAKTPDREGADLGRIIAAYADKWRRDSVLVIGYSRGAGTAPYAVNRLPPAQRAHVAALVLIGAEHTAGFHFGLRDIFRHGNAPDEVPVMPELRKLGALPLVCFYGDKERDTLCPELAPPAVVVKLPGDHHFNGAYAEIGQRMANVLGVR